MIYRIKQFYWAMTARPSAEDDLFIKNYLTAKELILFLKLRNEEQVHSIKVAQYMAKASLPDSKEAIRLGLLHDIGKIQYPLNPYAKSIMVLAHKLSKGKVQQYSQYKWVQGYYQHGLFGYELLKALDTYSLQFLEAVREHHSNRPTQNKYLIELRKCDDLA